MSGETTKDLAKIVGMILLGPVTFIGAIRADFDTPGFELIAGMLGTFLWFMILMEVMAYV